MTHGDDGGISRIENHSQTLKYSNTNSNSDASKKYPIEQFNAMKQTQSDETPKGLDILTIHLAFQLFI